MYWLIVFFVFVPIVGLAVTMIGLSKYKKSIILNAKDSKRLVEDLNKVSCSPEERKQRAELARKRRAEMLKIKGKVNMTNKALDNINPKQLLNLYGKTVNYPGLKAGACTYRATS